nr:benzoate/H(+) symporter BenE family transporter [Desulfitobacterium hafniense]
MSTEPIMPVQKPFAFEKAPGFFNGLRDAWKYLTLASIGSGIVAWFFGATKALIILDIATKAKMDNDLLVSWIFILYLTAGLSGIFLVLHYKQPFGMAWPIPAAVVIGNALSNKIAMTDIVGAYMFVGRIIIIVG